MTLEKIYRRKQADRSTAFDLCKNAYLIQYLVFSFQTRSKGNCTRPPRSSRRRTGRTRADSNKNRTKKGPPQSSSRTTTADTSSTPTTNRWRTPPWSSRTDIGRTVNIKGLRKAKRLPCAFKTIIVITRSRGVRVAGRVHLLPRASSKFRTCEGQC